MMMMMIPAKRAGFRDDSLREVLGLPLMLRIPDDNDDDDDDDNNNSDDNDDGNGNDDDDTFKRGFG